MSTAWVTRQLLSVKRTGEPSRFNPRPAGVMRPGSATEAAYAYLLARPGRGWVECRQIVAATKRSQKSLSWALIFLRTTGLIEASQDPFRARYLRYRVIK